MTIETVHAFFFFLNDLVLFQQDIIPKAFLHQDQSRKIIVQENLTRGRIGLENIDSNLGLESGQRT